MKFVFHRDRFDIHVYHPGMNHEGRNSGHDLMLNGTIPFDTRHSLVVPKVKRVSSVKTDNKVVGYVNPTEKLTTTIPLYQAALNDIEQKLENAQLAGDTELEVRAEIELRKFKNEWHEDRQDVETLIDYEFEIVDIDYPADDRMIPMRHVDGQKINYFEVDGRKIALDFIRSLCVGEGLTQDNSNKRRTFYVEDSRYSGMTFRLEGKSYQTNINLVRLKNFIGTLGECQEYIDSIEKAARLDYDEWVVSGKSPDDLTIGEVTKHLDEIESMIRRIDSKVKTQQQKEYAISRVLQAKNEIRAFAPIEETDDETEISSPSA
tara:strand:+ start:769 stop:1725 length:957 start_codon:yes stop_codon:yes gene_type:complete